MLWLALGAFAIGTETFMISGVLPVISGDLGVSVASAGLLVTAFAISYALASPVLATLTAGYPRRVVLITAMSLFGLANLVAASAPTYETLLASRVLLALAAAAFMPAASGYAATTVAPERRGRALAIVYTGMTVSMILGVPAGTLLADRFGWRASFVGVAILAAIAVAGVAVALKDSPSSPAAGLRQRLALALRPDILAVLVLTTAVLAGAFSLNTFFGAYLRIAIGVPPEAVAFFFLLVGVCGAIGNLLGGQAADRWDHARYLTLALIMMAIASASYPILAGLSRPAALAGIACAVTIGSMFGWSILAVQQVRLVSVDPALASISLSLNSSAIYLGSALGATTGALTVDFASVREVGWVSTTWILTALIILFVTTRRSFRQVAHT